MELTTLHKKQASWIHIASGLVALLTDQLDLYLHYQSPSNNISSVSSKALMMASTIV